MQSFRYMLSFFTHSAGKSTDQITTNPLQSLPMELQGEISELLTSTELNTLSRVNKAAHDNYRQDYFWKKRVINLGPLTQGSYYGQFWQKTALVKQKARLLAETFLKAHPNFTGASFYAGFDFWYQEFMAFAPAHLAEHIFNDPTINPLAIIDYAFTFLGLTPTSNCPLDYDKTTLLHTLANLGNPKILNAYITKYKDQLDINAGLSGIQLKAHDMSPLAYALDYMIFNEVYDPEAALVLLNHGAIVDTAMVEDWLEDIVENEFLTITDAFRDMLSQFVEKGLAKEKISEAFPQEYSHNRELYEAAEGRSRVRLLLQ